MSGKQTQIGLDADVLFEQRYNKECRRVHQFMILLMIAQWFGGIAFATFYSPLTWIGQSYQIHVHVWAAIILGGSISGFAILWIRSSPDSSNTRHIVALSQMCWSALLIHLSGGRIETHFHVFASLAILSIYRDWKILASATVIVAVDHFVRGVFYPLSAFGIVTESPYRWIEHAAWVLFEVSFLAPACMRLRNEIRELCVRQVELEHAKASVDSKVKERTLELEKANHRIEIQTNEARKLALVAQYTDNAVVLTDEYHRIEWVNDGFTRITGYSLDEVQGKLSFEFRCGPETDQTVLNLYEEALANRSGFDTEAIFYKKDGSTYWLAIEARPIYDESGKLSRFMAIESDISERVHAQLERQELNEQLVGASRSAGMAEVATGVLHNVGNILNSVNVSASVIRNQINRSALTKLERATELIVEHQDNFADFVRDDVKGQKLPSYLVKLTDALAAEHNEINEEFEDLLKNVEHIKEIVNVQQSMAKCSGIKQELDPEELLADVLTATKGSLTNHKINVRQEVASELPVLVSDKHKILQILINLVRNAKDAMVEHQTKDPTISIRVIANDFLVEFQVHDNGIGIPQDQLDKVFQHGYTTKQDGHGFGLHSCANAATELGGRLTAVSDGVGKGATFKLKIPTENQNHKQSFLETSCV